MLTDTHCHLDVFFDSGRLDNVINSAKENGVKSMIAVGTEESDWYLYDSISRNYDCVDFSVGLHPTLATNNWQTQIAKIPHFIDRVVAIGEIGLDFHHLSDNENLRHSQITIQKAAFSSQLQLAKNFNLPVIVHCRDAFAETIDIIRESGINFSKILFHCYAGDRYTTEQLATLGAYMSFSGVVTYKNAIEIRESLRLVPLNRLLIETDSPFLAPTPMRGNENQPAFIIHIAKYIAQFLEIDLDTLCLILEENKKNWLNKKEVQNS